MPIIRSYTLSPIFSCFPNLFSQEAFLRIPSRFFSEAKAPFFPILHLVNAVVAIAFLGSVLGVFPAFTVTHHTHRFAFLPVARFGTVFLIDGGVTILGERPITTITCQDTVFRNLEKAGI